MSTARHNADVPGLVRLYAQFSIEASDPGHPSHDEFVERYARVRELITADITARQAAGTLPSSLDPAAAASLLIAAADGLQVQWLLDPEVDMAAHLSSLVSLLGSAPAPAARSVPAR